MVRNPAVTRAIVKRLVTALILSKVLIAVFMFRPSLWAERAARTNTLPITAPTEPTRPPGYGLAPAPEPPQVDYHQMGHQMGLELGRQIGREL